MSPNRPHHDNVRLDTSSDTRRRSLGRPILSIRRLEDRLLLSGSALTFSASLPFDTIDPIAPIPVLVGDEIPIALIPGEFVPDDPGLTTDSPDPADIPVTIGPGPVEVIDESIGPVDLALATLPELGFVPILEEASGIGTEVRPVGELVAPEVLVVSMVAPPTAGERPTRGYALPTDVQDAPSVDPVTESIASRSALPLVEPAPRPAAKSTSESFTLAMEGNGTASTGPSDFEVQLERRLQVLTDAALRVEPAYAYTPADPWESGSEPTALARELSEAPYEIPEYRPIDAIATPAPSISWARSFVELGGLAVLGACIYHSARESEAVTTTPTLVDDHERRREPRFSPILGDLVELEVVRRDRRHPVRLCGRIRDLSESGMGFLHLGPLPGREVRISFLHNGQSLTRMAGVRWSRRLTGEVFVSGVKFDSDSASEPTSA